MSPEDAFFAHLGHDLSSDELDRLRAAVTHVNDLESALAEQDVAAVQASAIAAAARGLVVVTSSLLGACSPEDDLPTATYLQVKALLVQIPPLVDAGWQAIGNPRFRARGTLPLPLEPRMSTHSRRAPAFHRGLEAAARALLAKPSRATAPVSEALERERSALRARAEERLATAAAWAPLGGKTDDIEQALFGAAADAFVLVQLYALAEPVDPTTVGLADASGRDVRQEDRWSLSHEKAVAMLRDTPHGEDQIRSFWQRKSWRITGREERYLAQCQELVSHGAIRAYGHWAGPPYDPVFHTIEPIRILDVAVEPEHEVRLEMDENRDELLIGAPHLRGCRPLSLSEIER